MESSDRAKAIEAGLKMKWSRRVHGDSPLVVLERVFGENGDPAGYRPLTGVALLSPEQRAAFDKLGPEFSFKDAQTALDRGPDPTNKFLKKCRAIGLIEKIGWGKYKRLG